VRSKKVYFAIGLFAVILIVVYLLASSTSDPDGNIIVSVKEGEFVVEVNTTGELDARNSIKILGPSNLRKYRIYQVNIQKIIPEGTFVKKGQFVASLDPSEIAGKVKDNQIQVEERETKYLQTKLDTALRMREARDKLYNLEFAVEEKQLVVDESQFEPPATIKRVGIELEKARRQFEQEKENYKIKKQQNVADMQIAQANLRKEQLEREGMMELQNEFNIMAPEDGMLIYSKGWDGKPIKEGSQIGAWDPVVATLPDLSTMNSITYVNEVDIRRIQKGQFVHIGLDAFPEKQLSGAVVDVANVGEQRPNSDSKVFKVTIEISKSDPLLRPGMTTSNRIITKEFDNVLFVPLECLHGHQDSITYVYKKEGLSYSKQEVVVGETNANDAQILIGLNAEDQVYLSQPTDDNENEIILLDEMNGKRNSKGGDSETAKEAIDTKKKNQKEG
jgi:HlyD family secretion protein